jgi:DNA modification methylase
MNQDYKTEWWAIDKVIPYDKNPREIPKSALHKVGLSLKENKWRQPIVVDKDGVIVVGHVRWMAAGELGMDQVLVHVADDMAPSKIRAYRLMDNRSHEETGWEPELLRLEMVELNAIQFDLQLTGFDPPEIDEFLVNLDLGEEVADLVLPPPTRPITALGEVWRCGDHRVLCGDSTKPQDVTHLLIGIRPLLMISDAPYGVQYDAMWREEAGLGVQRQTGKIANDDRVDWSAAHGLFSGDIAYIWHAGVHSGPVAAGIVEVGFDIRAQIIWIKPNFVLSRGAYHFQHEPCYYCVRKGARSLWRGDRTQSSVWPVASLNPFGGKNQEETATGHGNQKPIELTRRPILNHLERGDAVYDPFLGSGTTLIAAELTGRICYGIEILPKYVDLAVCRWQRLTRRSATLEGDGRSFDELQSERSGNGAVQVGEPNVEGEPDVDQKEAA